MEPILTGFIPFAFLAAAALPQFVDMTAQSGIAFKHEASHSAEKYLLESMSGGVAIFDYDGDGKLDLFFVNGASLPTMDKSGPRYWNRLYRNNGNFTFTDITERAGVRGHSYGMGAATGDFDNDGRIDLYVSNYGRNILYRNRGDGTFADVTDQAGAAAAGWSTGAMFVDYDRDGALDLFVSRYVDWNFSHNPYCGDRKPGFRAYCHPDQFKPVSHLLLHNNRNGTFTDVSVKSGIAKAQGKGLGVAFQDYDRDGWPDILVANDSFPQQLFHNKRDGTFEEVALALGLAYDDDGRTFAGMGADFADYDNDGWPDVFINALANQRYSLFRNLKESFEYVTGASGVGKITARHSGWGTRFLDYDNDGWVDLFVAQGHVMDNIELTQPGLRYLEPPLLMRNVKGKFEDVSMGSGEIFKTPLAARGAAFGDLDNDGFTDVVISCNDGRPVILRNHGNTNQWLTVNVVERAVGARVKLTGESGAILERLVSTAGSYLSASDPRVMFGLGQDRRIRSIEVTWPDGAARKVENPEPGRIVNIAPR